MVLHVLSRPVTPFAALSRRGLRLPMHLHENRPTKRAGEAGKALRADAEIIFFIRLKGSISSSSYWS
ncbi:TPA: hypothetical protein MHQ49_17135 [Klebsiella pneumoniae]|nr:hypothetical protein [Klebsiella pneumoniae]